MKIKVTIRAAKLKQLTVEEQEERETKRLISGESDNPNNLMGQLQNLPIQFIYKSRVLDSTDIAGFEPIDKRHTLIYTYLGEDIIVKMSFDSFSQAYEEATGSTIRVFQEKPLKKEEL